eukprot:CAMPEP_0173098038 /NCGR_PEP_ID=MMETSP1102-20130122/34418_1 /TAXON_ID=49646 /ORGANISM="Geminigera sp., Strain Caron Lab Isolate" /LENGTH=163 /DNA_ID=CAMNT_0013990309 /DNA_START=139 /DNA_END=627 /DNA_ORIENTATION=+
MSSSEIRVIDSIERWRSSACIASPLMPDEEILQKKHSLSQIELSATLTGSSAMAADNIDSPPLPKTKSGLEAKLFSESSGKLFERANGREASEDISMASPNSDSSMNQQRFVYEYKKCVLANVLGGEGPFDGMGGGGGTVADDWRDRLFADCHHEPSACDVSA